VFILNNYKMFVFFPTKVLFIFDKEYISVNTKSKNTENKTMCSSWSKRNSPFINLLFSEKL